MKEKYNKYTMRTNITWFIVIIINKNIYHFQQNWTMAVVTYW